MTHIAVGYEFITELTGKSFTGAVNPGDGKTAVQHIGDLILAAQAVHTASKTRPPAGTNAVADLKAKQARVATAAAPADPKVIAAASAAEDKVVSDILRDACLALNAGCFAAGTKLLTKAGWRAVEEIGAGEEVASRSELDPTGEVCWKAVEACFRRTGRILHLHFPGGELIRTTPEHPFWVEGKEWTAAGV